MQQQIIRTLNVYYYGVMALTLLAGTLMYFLIMKDYVQPIDSLSAMGQTIQYIVIFDALLTIPLGLYLCKKQCTKLSTLENEEEKLRGYQYYGICYCSVLSHGSLSIYAMGGCCFCYWLVFY